MADLWTKKKKILTRKDRFKITEDLMKSKYKEDTAEKLQTEEEETYQQFQAEEMQQQSLALQEHKKCISSLSFICQRFHYFHETTITSEVQSRNKFMQSKYPQCKNLKRIVPWINEFISELKDQKSTEKHRIRLAINDCIGLLSTLDMYLENPLYMDHIENWYECKRTIRDLLYENIDADSYNVLTNIEKEMSYLNADVMYYKYSCEFFTYAIWTVLDKIRNAKDEKFPLICNFEDCGVIVHLPKVFANKALAVRCLIMLTDYFTSDCATAVQFELPQGWRLSLLEHVQNAWAKKQQMQEQMEKEKTVLREEHEKRDSIIGKIRYLIPSSVESKDTETTSRSLVSDVADTSPAEFSYLKKVIHMKKLYADKALSEEKNEIENIKKYFKTETRLFECNMRKYHIVGGVYHLDLLEQPPQPKELKDGAIIRLIIGEDALQRWPYLETYEFSSAKTQSTDDDDEDVENIPEGALIAKLVLIVMKLPDHVLWFDAPIPVHWDYENDFWSTEYIYEVKFNEEKQTLSFRTGKMTAFGLAVFKFNNLPFQSWELKQSGGSVPEVTFTLTTSTLALEFVIRADEITLTMLENANTSALQELVGVPHKPRTLLKILRKGGVNIFPSTDAFHYIDGVPVKHHVTEDHLYRCMAMLCLCYRFSWSRWNLMSGYKRFVLQIRDMEVAKANELLLVTDQRAFVTESTDVNQAFAEYENSGSASHPDLWSLATERGGEQVQLTVDNMETVFIETVYFMLSQTKIMSYS